MSILNLCVMIAGVHTGQTHEGAADMGLCEHRNRADHALPGCSLCDDGAFETCACYRPVAVYLHRRHHDGVHCDISSRFLPPSPQAGFACAYVVFISTNMHSLVPALSYGEWTGTLFILHAAICQPRDLQFLAPVTMLGFLAELFAVLVVVWHAGEEASSRGAHEQFAPPPTPSSSQLSCQVVIAP